MKSSLSAIIMAFVITGCSTPSPSLRVTYRSDPPGATFYRLDRQLWGKDGGSFTYRPTPAELEQGYVRWRGMVARWPSGAEAEINPIRFDFSRGMNQTLTWFRPANAPGVEIDAVHAMTLEQNRIAQQQADAASRSAAAASRAATAAQSDALMNLINTSTYQHDRNRALQAQRDAQRRAQQQQEQQRRQQQWQEQLRRQQQQQDATRRAQERQRQTQQRYESNRRY